MKSEDLRRDHWQAEARKVARRVNLAWWLEAISAPLLVVALLGAAGLLLARRELAEADMRVVAAAVVGSVVVLALGCWARAARKFEKPEQSLVRIEAAMHLRNGLSAAAAGVAPWPAPRPVTRTGLAWQWPRLLIPPVGALVLLAAGIFLPVSARVTQPSVPLDQPQAWKQLAAELDHLAKEEVVDEKYLEETRQRLDELKSQQEDQWFSHSSLEATDSLKKSHRAEASRVEQELGHAANALDGLTKNAPAANDAEKNRLMEEFDQALEGLRNGAMKPNPQLLEQLKQLDPANLGKISAEQMQQLREKLKENAEAMKNGAPGGEGDEWADELLAGDGDGDGGGEGEGEGKEGEGPGKGGVDRGPGHAPGVLGAEKNRLEIGELTGLASEDLSRATPGDLLELQDGQHDVDQAASAMGDGGTAADTGKGGDRVWRDALDPAEQRALKRYFK